MELFVANMAFADEAPETVYGLELLASPQFHSITNEWREEWLQNLKDECAHSYQQFQDEPVELMWLTYGWCYSETGRPNLVCDLLDHGQEVAKIVIQKVETN